MSSAAAVEALFFAALEKGTAVERADYLDSACGSDAELRRQVEKLLNAHPWVGDFLKKPALEQLAAVPEPSDASQGPDASTDGRNDEDSGVGFLQPSTRSDSLGRLGHYEVLQVLGRGGFGIVLRAFDETLQRAVAVKVLAAHIAATSPARKRFVREARSSAKVRHENVVQVYAVEEQPLPYLVMELIPGETLQQRCDRIGPLEVPDVLRIGRQIAEGLAAAHATGLIHRDVKPANVLIEVGPHERVKLTDFGLARAADDASLSQSGMVAGTPMYMAPEQAQGDKLDPRADLFSLGSVLYVMCTGRPPFRARTTFAVLKRVAEDEPRPIREVIPEVPEWLCGIVAKLHAKDPAARFQTAREVADLLADCEAKLKAQQEVKNILPAPALKPAGRKKWIVTAAVVLLPVIALAVTELDGVTHLFRGQEPTPVPAVKHEALPPTFRNSIGMEFVIVPKGKSWLGGGEDRLGDKEVEITADFYLGKYEVTQEEWEKVMGENPSCFSRTGGGRDAVKDSSDEDLKRFPVETVTWDQCQVFVAKLNKREKETGWVYRLPKEAEWEYACRGGPMADRLDSAFNFCLARPTNTLLPEQANFDKGLNRTCKVGSYEANRLGLFDMHGNVSELCDDIAKSDDEVLQVARRGGSWWYTSQFCVATYRFACKPSWRDTSIGLRLARVPSGAPSLVVKPVRPSANEATWERSVAVRPAEEQVKFVVARLQTLNPKFDGTDTTTIKDDVVTGLELHGAVSDLSPLRALTKLSSLNCTSSNVSDLSPLKDMKLTYLNCTFTPVTDLTPLKDMKLTHLDCGGTAVSDLSPLKGMPLTRLVMSGTKVTDLSPLKGMPLNLLGCSDSQVADLSPLKGLPLTVLWCNNTAVSDLTPLKEVKLKALEIKGTRVTDLLPLRAIPTLQSINGKPVAEFWKEVDAKIKD